MFQLKLAYKMQSKTLLIGTLLILAYTLIGVVGLKDGVSWFYIKLFLPILPVFYTSNVISEEHEQGRAGIIFTTCTPIYLQATKRFFSGLLLNALLSIILYACAYAVGLESSILGVVPILAYSFFFSSLSFTFCNLTHKNVVGFGIVILYWGLFFMAGTKANELLMPFSPIINMELFYDVVWYNVFSMASFGFILFLLNLWLISKGEGIRKKVLALGVPTSLILVVMPFIIPDTSYLTRTEWHTTQQDDVTLMYQDLPSVIEEEFLTIWNATYEVLVDLLGEEHIASTLQVFCETGISKEPTYSEDVVTLNFLRKHLNPTHLGGDFFHTTIPEVALNTYLFGSLEDHSLAEGFAYYLSLTRINEVIFDKDSAVVNTKYFDYYTATEQKEGYLQDLAYYKTASNINPYEAKYVAGLILLAIDESSPTALNSFLVALSILEDTITLDTIHQLALQFATPLAIDEAIATYQAVAPLY